MQTHSPDPLTLACLRASKALESGLATVETAAGHQDDAVPVMAFEGRLALALRNNNHSLHRTLEILPDLPSRVVVRQPGADHPGATALVVTGWLSLATGETVLDVASALGARRRGLANRMLEPTSSFAIYLVDVATCDVTDACGSFCLDADQAALLLASH